MPTAISAPQAAPAVLQRHGAGRWLVPAGGALVAVFGLLWLKDRPPTVQYLTAPVSRGAIVRAVIATGSVNPVTTVQVGAFVSGTIQTLYCDYNTRVKAGQLCAKIDPRPYQMVVDQNAAEVSSARAQLVKDQANLRYVKLNYDRDAGLLTQGVASQDNVDSDKSSYDQAVAQVALDQASIAEHEAALRAANVNLQYTNIVSPVQGTVISRNIDVGQTVAASFQTPMLFLVATDLTQMQVDASVSESDIGALAEGQRATFTVEAYPNRTFTGQIAQIRRAPITVQNVVTYDVVIAVSNPDQLLLPGMTANSRLITSQRDSVLRIPLQALRYSPHGLGPQGSAGAASTHGKELWVLRDGKAEAVSVVTGVDDGTLAEVVSGTLTANDQVVIGENTAGSTSRSANVSGAGQTPRPSMRF